MAPDKNVLLTPFAKTSIVTTLPRSIVYVPNSYFTKLNPMQWKVPLILPRRRTSKVSCSNIAEFIRFPECILRHYVGDATELINRRSRIEGNKLHEHVIVDVYRPELTDIHDQLI